MLTITLFSIASLIKLLLITSLEIFVNTCGQIPVTLVQTWFWMAFVSHDKNLNTIGEHKITRAFGSVKKALDKYPDLN